MDGKLQPFIDALITHYQAENLKREAGAGAGLTAAPVKA
jgi:hypothetical protein